MAGTNMASPYFSGFNFGDAINQIKTNPNAMTVNGRSFYSSGGGIDASSYDGDQGRAMMNGGADNYYYRPTQGQPGYHVQRINSVNPGADLENMFLRRQNQPSSGYSVSLDEDLPGMSKMRGRDFYDDSGNYLRSDTFSKGSDYQDMLGVGSILAAPFAAYAMGLGAPAAGAAAGGGGGLGAELAAQAAANVIPASSGAFIPATAGEMGLMGLGGAAATTGAAGGGGLGSILSKLGTQFGGKVMSSVLPSIFNGGGSSGGSGGGFNLGDIFNVGAGIYGSNQQGKAAGQMMDWMNNQQNYVRNYGAEGTPEFEYLKKTLEAKDAAAGRNSQYGPRSVDLLGQLGQAKLDASSRMALGFANPYQKALNQDANKYAGLPAAINKLLGGGGGVVQNLSSILGNLGGGSGMSNNDFIDLLNKTGSMPTGMDYDPSTMPTEDDILPFLENMDFDWLS